MKKNDPRLIAGHELEHQIVYQKVCKFRIDYFCNAIFKNE